MTTFMDPRRAAWKKSSRKCLCFSYDTAGLFLDSPRVLRKNDTLQLHGSNEGNSVWIHYDTSSIITSIVFLLILKETKIKTFSWAPKAMVAPRPWVSRA